MEEFWSAVFYFNGYLRNPTNAGRAGEFAELCAFPQIAQSLNEVDEARNKRGA